MIEDFQNTVINLKEKKQGIYRGSCPNHSRTNENLMVFVNDKGGINLHCHAHCVESEILDGLGLDRPCLFPERTPQQTEHWREKQADKLQKRIVEDQAHSLWVELRVLSQALEGRIFGGDVPITGKFECYDREKQALRLLPKMLTEYYK